METIFSKRIESVRGALSQLQVDGLLVTNLVNCTWLSGFTGSAAALLITADSATLATDSRYWEQAAAQAPDYELFKDMRRPRDTAEFLQSVGVAAIGLESNHVTLQKAEELAEIAGITWQPLNRPIEPLRRVKTEKEIAAVRAAAALTDAAMARLPSMISSGISERELAWKLEQRMRDDGASGMAFPPIVAFGTNSARPHHAPGDRELRAGDIVLVDMGAKLNGYCSDLTRTFLFGDAQNDLFQNIYNIVLAAQTKAAAELSPGINSQEAHKIAADVIAAAGYGENFTHGLGHGLGLEIHEDPFLSPIRPPQILQRNMVLTIEPGIYLPGWGGVRIEDLVVVHVGGSETLSQSLKSPSLPVL